MNLMSKMSWAKHETDAIIKFFKEKMGLDTLRILTVGNLKTFFLGYKTKDGNIKKFHPLVIKILGSKCSFIYEGPSAHYTTHYLFPDLKDFVCNRKKKFFHQLNSNTFNNLKDHIIGYKASSVKKF